MPVFCFTDIEGSTGKWELYKEAMNRVIARHYALMDEIVPRHGGRIIKKTGDGIFALFPDPAEGEPCEGLACALELQRHFQDEEWPGVGDLRVRMGLHVGQAMEMAGDFYGPTANRTARLMALAWGGQILVSEDLQRQAMLPPDARWVDLGVHQVKDLPEPQRLFGMVHPALRLAEFPPPKSLSSRLYNLPESGGPLLGRERELALAARLLADPQSRLVCLLGRGGMGKTRLALQAAALAAPQSRDGVHFADLSSLDAPEQLVARLAASLKLARGSEDPLPLLMSFLKDKQLLLVLDGLDAVAGRASALPGILEGAPGLRVLATSCRRLDLQEAVVEMSGLGLPREPKAADLEQCPAGALFLQQAKRANPSFALMPDQRPELLRLLILLEGMPLGLELAAAWTRMMPLKTIADRVEKDPRFLSGSRQDLPERQRSLKALFERALSLLSPREREALARLSAIQGPVSADAALAVAKAGPELLSSLADHCLLKPDGSAFSMSPLTRRLASFKLAEDAARREDALSLHATYFCRLPREKARDTRGFLSSAALAELRQSEQDLELAWDRAVEQGWIRELGLAMQGLLPYLDAQGLGHSWAPRLEQALALWAGSEARIFGGLDLDVSQAAYASLLACLANCRFHVGRTDEALALMEKSLRLCRQLGRRADSAYALVRMAVFLGPEDGRRAGCLDEALALYKDEGDLNGVAWAQRNQGHLLCRQGHLKDGRALLEQSMAAFKELGNPRELAWCQSALAQAALDSGEAEQGLAGLKRARDLFLELGDVEGAGWASYALGRAAAQRSAWKDAEASMLRSLRLFTQLRNPRARAEALRRLCEIEAGMGAVDQAFKVVDQIITESEASQDWSGLGSALLQKSRLKRQTGSGAEALPLLEQARQAFSQACSAAGEASCLEDLAVALQEQGEGGKARQALEQAIQGYSQCGNPEGEARSLVRMSDLDLAEGRLEKSEACCQQAIKMSRIVKLGEHSLAALLGIAALYHRQGRMSEALRLAVVCERAINEGLLPAPHPGFHAATLKKSEALLSLLGSKIMQSVIDAARAKVAAEDLRLSLKEAIDKLAA
jgi:class 3 adenylate cyclase/predicted ATPase